MDEAAGLLQTYPHVHFDLAPGVEILHNFTRHRSAARDFFVEFADRILLGTDTGLGDHATSPDRGVMVRRFLETEDRFPVPQDPAMTPDTHPDLYGLGLAPDVIETIGRRNFQRIVGADTPRPLHRANTRQIVRALSDDLRRQGGDETVTRILLDEI